MQFRFFWLEVLKLPTLVPLIPGLPGCGPSKIAHCHCYGPCVSLKETKTVNMTGDI